MIDTIRINKTWKNIKIIKKVFDLFGHKNIFFVGGAVRDCILGQPLRDIDLAVKNKVSDVKKKLHKAKINFVDNSKGHGTVSLIYKENSIEMLKTKCPDIFKPYIVYEKTIDKFINELFDK